MTDGDYRGRFINSLAFGLDRFQVEAIDAVDEHVNVLVSAPTGSGQDADRQLRHRANLRTRGAGLLHDAAEGALESEVRRALRPLRRATGRTAHRATSRSTPAPKSWS